MITVVMAMVTVTVAVFAMIMTGFGSLAVIVRVVVVTMAGVVVTRTVEVGWRCAAFSVVEAVLPRSRWCCAHPRPHARGAQRRQ